jgi:hypothetical protein
MDRINATDAAVGVEKNRKYAGESDHKNLQLVIEFKKLVQEARLPYQD